MLAGVHGTACVVRRRLPGLHAVPAALDGDWADANADPACLPGFDAPRIRAVRARCRRRRSYLDRQVPARFGPCTLRRCQPARRSFAMERLAHAQTDVVWRVQDRAAIVTRRASP